jgi:hypothetical protein
LQKQVGFYEYGVSPFQLKTFHGFLNPGAFNYFKKMSRQAMFIFPPLTAYWLLSSWADSKFEYYHRKEYLLSEEGLAASQ